MTEKEITTNIDRLLTVAAQAKKLNKEKEALTEIVKPYLFDNGIDRVERPGLGYVSTVSASERQNVDMDEVERIFKSLGLEVPTKTTLVSESLRVVPNK